MISIKVILPKIIFLCFVNRTSLYSPVDNANSVHNLFLVYLSVSTCFGRLCAHHQEKQVCLCNTWYLLFCMDDCLVCRVDRQSSVQNNKYQVSHKYSCFSWWWAHSRPKHVEIVKYISSSSSVGAITLGGFWPALRFRSTIFCLYTSLSPVSHFHIL